MRFNPVPVLIIFGVIQTLSFQKLIAQFEFSASPSSPLILQNDSDRNHFQLNGSIYRQSKSIPGSFANAFMFNSGLNNEVKNLINEKLKRQNHYLDAIEAEFRFSHQFKRSNSSHIQHALTAGMRTTNSRIVSAPQDAIQLMLYGNSMFEGDTADLSDLSVDYLYYNTFYGGYLISKKNNNKLWYAAFDVGLVQSPVNAHAQSNQTSVYTAPYGEYLDLSYDFNLKQSNTGAVRFFEGAGGGLSAGLQGGIANEKWSIRASAYNFGFIKMWKQTSRFAADTSMRFDGLYVNLNDLTESASGFQFNEDSLLNYTGVHKTIGQYTVSLPGTIEVLSKVKINDQIALGTGLKYRFIRQYIPYLWLKPEYKTRNNWAFCLQAVYGGYAGFHGGVEISKRLNHFNATLGTTELDGWLNSKKSTAASVFFHLSYSFK